MLYTIMMQTYHSSFHKIGWIEPDEAYFKSTITNWLQDIQTPLQDNVTTVVLPHAGMSFAGQTTIQTLRHCAGKTYDRIIMLGPSHYEPLMGRSSIINADAINTVIGTLSLDRPAIDDLVQSGTTFHHHTLHSKEHALQILMPYLQAFDIQGPILPIVMGFYHLHECQDFAEALRPYLTNNSLLVISTDFTHYGPNFDYEPFADPSNVEQQLEQLNQTAITHLLAKDCDNFVDYLDQTKNTICGRIPLIVMLLLLNPESQGFFETYTSSGALTNDWQNVVCYASMGYRYEQL